jgi:hypothetical protein
MGFLNVNKPNPLSMRCLAGKSMQKLKVTRLPFRFKKTSTLFKIVTPLILAILLFSALTPPLRAALTPARDLTGTWGNAIAEKYYDLDPSDPTTRMNDANVIYSMQITQSGSSISIVLNIQVSSYTTDPAYMSEYGMAGVPMVGFNQIVFSGTVSGASFSADEQYTSTGNQEHIAGTFTTDIITATLTGPNENTDTNGIIVLRSGSSATLPPTVTASPTPSPTPAPALPTADNLASVSQIQGSVWYANNGQSVSSQSAVGTGSEVKTASDGIIGFNYPDNGGVVYLSANSDAGWVYLEPITDPVNGNISYVAVPPPATGAFAFSEGIEPDELGQAGVGLAAEVGVGLAIMAVTGAPITLGGALVVEGTILLGSGIAYINEQMSQPDGTYHVRPIETPQGMVMGDGTQYVVTVSTVSTTIQVIEGSAIFVDQYTNNTVTVSAGQMLTLPSGVSTGFSQQDLQAKISIFDSSAINQWWNITPVATATESTPTVTATPIVAGPTTGATDFLSNPMILAALLLIVIIAIAVLLAVIRSRKKSSKRSRLSTQMTNTQNIPPPPPTPETPKTTVPTTQTVPTTATTTPTVTQPKLAFCPDCGKQLSNPKGFCPFCGFDLAKFKAEATK